MADSGLCQMYIYSLYVCVRACVCVYVCVCVCVCFTSVV